MDPPKPLASLCVAASLSPPQDNKSHFPPRSPSRNLPKPCSLPPLFPPGSSGPRGSGTSGRLFRWEDKRPARRRGARRSDVSPLYPSVGLGDVATGPLAGGLGEVGKSPWKSNVSSKTWLWRRFVWSQVTWGHVQKCSSMSSRQRHCDATRLGEEPAGSLSHSCLSFPTNSAGINDLFHPRSANACRAQGLYIKNTLF